MKDIVENRRRIGLGTKFKLIMISIRENGPLYFLFLGISYLGTNLSSFGFRKSDELRKAKRLPGMNSRAANKLIWENWDWSAKGDEWTPSAGWKDSIVRTFIDPYFPGLQNVLEIGPGAGRWTEYLVGRVGQLVGIDISETCVAECRQRFASHSNARFELGNGLDLKSVDSASIDGIWSFDVFVHINDTEFRSYFGEFARVLKSGGVGVIHHGTQGGSSGGWRSNVTVDDIRRFMTETGLETVSQVTSWTDSGEEHEAGLYGDMITVVRKP